MSTVPSSTTRTRWEVSAVEIISDVLCFVTLGVGHEMLSSLNISVESTGVLQFPQNSLKEQRERKRERVRGEVVGMETETERQLNFNAQSNSMGRICAKHNTQHQTRTTVEK